MILLSTCKIVSFTSTKLSRHVIGQMKHLMYSIWLTPKESDHLCFTFRLQHFQHKKYATTVHNIFKTDYTEVREELAKHDWHEVLSSNFEADYDTFFNYHRNFLEKHSPLTKSPKERKNIPIEI